MASHEGFEPTDSDNWRRQPSAQRSGLREVLGEQSNGVAPALHDRAIRTLAAVQLMLAEAADGLTAGEHGRVRPVTPAFCSTGGASVGAGVAATLFLAIGLLDLCAAGLLFL